MHQETKYRNFNLVTKNSEKLKKLLFKKTIDLSTVWRRQH